MLTCQTFQKPMEIEKKKKVSESKCNTKKINVFKQNNYNAINSLQYVKPV